MSTFRRVDKLSDRRGDYYGHSISCQLVPNFWWKCSTAGSDTCIDWCCTRRDSRNFDGQSLPLFDLVLVVLRFWKLVFNRCRLQVFLPGQVPLPKGEVAISEVFV